MSGAPPIFFTEYNSSSPNYNQIVFNKKKGDEISILTHLFFSFDLETKAIQQNRINNKNEKLTSRNKHHKIKSGAVLHAPSSLNLIKKSKQY